MEDRSCNRHIVRSDDHVTLMASGALRTRDAISFRTLQPSLEGAQLRSGRPARRSVRL